MAGTKELALDAIRIDGGTQARVRLSIETVDDYAERYKAGDDFPLPICYFDGSEYCAVGGGPKQEEYRQRRASEPHDVRVALGKKKVVERIINSADEIETGYDADPQTFERQRVIRLGYWHCWSCGTQQNGNGDSERHLCSECATAIV